MQRLLLHSTLILFAFWTGLASVAMGQYRFPAEFEKQEAVWIAWPTGENKQGMSSVPTYVELVRKLTKYIRVNIVANDTVSIDGIETMLHSQAIDPDSIRFYPVANDLVWMRDFGPIFVKNDLDPKRLSVVRFNFNSWGYESQDSHDSRIGANTPVAIAKLLDLPIVPSPVVSEGGDRSCNGAGMMIANERVELARNPGMGKKEIEAQFERVLGIKKTLWVDAVVYDDIRADAGRVIGPDGKLNAYNTIATGGHVDEFVRFVGPDTILLAEVPEREAQTSPIRAFDYENTQRTYELLKKAQNLDGKPFRIVRIPFPAKEFYTLMHPGDGAYDYLSKLTFKDGSVFPKGKPVYVMAAASYVNFLITNGAVIVPQYWQKGMDPSIKESDREAMRVFKSLFPDRDIVPINPLVINFGGGGIHCITQQQPLVGK